MKKFIAVLLALVMCLSLCACGTTTVNDVNMEVYGWGPYIYIRDVDGQFDDPYELSHWLGYHRETNIIYECYGLGTRYSYVTPHQIYENGAIYGAVYENGEIVPVPYALGVTPEMVESQIGSWFN